MLCNTGVYYFFSHEDSRDGFQIPHDLKILKEIFDIDPGQYSSNNAFWDSFGMQSWYEMHKKILCNDTQTQLNEKIKGIKHRYNATSESYQSSKVLKAIPLN